MTARLLMIGLDGADGRRIDRFSADGALPRLGALRARGRAHVLAAPPGLTDDALWASFQYGVEVGEHGRYFYAVPQSDGAIGKAHWAEVDRPTFWDELSAQGQRVAVLDVPKCRNPRPLNGIHLVDWVAHGGYFPKPRSQPKALAADVARRFGPPPASRFDYLMPFLEDAKVDEIVRDLRDAIAKKRAAGLHYLAAERWDLFVLGFMEAHCACHTFWDFDPSHEAYEPARRARLGDPLMTILSDVDAAVGDLVAAAGPDAEVVVFAPTDFRANGSLEHLMPRIVERLNAHLPAEGQCSILPYNEAFAALRVSKPDPRWLQAIEAQLAALRDAATGERAVSAVTRPSAEMRGSRAAQLPDLLIHAPPGRFPRAVASTQLGRIEADPPSMRPGNHAPGGFVIAAGALAVRAIDGVASMADFASLAKTVLAREPAAR